eukprot:CAMPEP_0203901170 /NCGR_PEP_ID=MMETSP0359-20131031/43373_1 /ASSEMBLY_ACC=CAM_ASM_000338 /TAXON_ID=268821 /ORGANISM="Scrippsiella Hangoei, Strain SHTV-5" /LENGTH=85 /DNA_ID=CAMNT_0050824785 /DNA_START=25 /DNA_END=278 /DNA_ORIENTATION=+
MGCFGSRLTASEVQGANGRIVKGSRVQTVNTVAEGGDGSWYQGTVQDCFADGEVKILYDDGDKWTGSAQEVYLFDAQAGDPGDRG